KDELAQLQRQLQTGIRPDMAEAAKAIVNAIDDLERRVQTILEEKRTIQLLGGTIVSRTAKMPQKGAVQLGFATIGGICLALVGLLALTVGYRSSASFQLSSAQIGATPIGTAQIPQEATPAASPVTRRSVQLEVNRSLLRATLIDATYTVVHFGGGV